MIFQQGIGEKTGARGKGYDQKSQCSAVQPPQWSAYKEQPSRSSEYKAEPTIGYPRDRVIKKQKGRPTGENKSTSGFVKKPAGREVDLRCEEEKSEEKGRDADIDRRRLHSPQPLGPTQPRAPRASTPPSVPRLTRAHPVALPEGDGNHLVGFGAARSGDLYALAGALADQSARQGGGHR